MGVGLNKASHFDIEALLMLEEIMEDEFPELIQVYIADSDPRIEAMKQAYNEKNCNTLGDISHSFKGASGNVSALPLADICYKIEEKAREEDLEGIPSLIASVDDEYQNVRSILLSLIP